jgi:anti-sigma factor RsiW
MKTMNCTSCQEKLLEDADGTLGAAERAALGQHLAECSDCRTCFAREAALAARLRSTFRQRAESLHLAPSVRAQFLAEAAPQHARAWWRAPACAAAAAALILCAAHFALRSASPALPHVAQDFVCMSTTPDHTVRIEWKSPSHVVIERSAGWKERRLVVMHRNGTEASGLFVAHPLKSLWK